MVLCKKPLIAYGQNLIDKSYCEDIISYSQDKFIQSRAYSEELNHHTTDEWRTSSTFIDHSDYCNRLRLITLDVAKDNFPNYNINLANIELTQIQRYNINQHYMYHCDYFNFGRQIVDNDRIATLIFYLNDTFTGGETFFNRLNIKVKPIQGSALFFAYNYDRETNVTTEHSGEKVLHGVKYIATCWIRQFPFN